MMRCRKCDTEGGEKLDRIDTLIEDGTTYAVWMCLCSSCGKSFSYLEAVADGE